MTPCATLRRLLAAAPIALLLAGCASSERSEPSHLLWPGDRTAQETPPPRKPAVRSVARPAKAEASVRKAAAEDRPSVTVASPADDKSETEQKIAAPAPDAPPAKAEAPPPAPPQVSPKAMADANSGALSALRRQPAAEKQAAAPAPATLPPAPPPVVVKNATPAAADKPTAPKATAPAPAKSAPAHDEIGDAIVQAELHLRIGNIDAARKMLEPHVRAAHPEAMAELGRTFDPIELAAILAPANAADPARAAELYTEASKKGSSAAGLRLARLQQWMAQKQQKP